MYPKNRDFSNNLRISRRNEKWRNIDGLQLEIIYSFQKISFQNSNFHDAQLNKCGLKVDNLFRKFLTHGF